MFGRQVFQKKSFEKLVGRVGWGNCVKGKGGKFCLKLSGKSGLQDYLKIKWKNWPGQVVLKICMEQHN